jgi:hypothetical protein
LIARHQRETTVDQIIGHVENWRSPTGFRRLRFAADQSKRWRQCRRLMPHVYLNAKCARENLVRSRVL